MIFFVIQDVTIPQKRGLAGYSGANTFQFAGLIVGPKFVIFLYIVITHYLRQKFG